MEWKHLESKINQLARWVWEWEICKQVAECPRVGYLGYANGMSECEWLTVCLAQRILDDGERDFHDYFDYKVDSSD